MMMTSLNSVRDLSVGTFCAFCALYVCTVVLNLSVGTHTYFYALYAHNGKHYLDRSSGRNY